MSMKKTFALQPHPTTPCPFVTAIDVVAEVTTTALQCTYTVHGAIDQLAIPPTAAIPARMDELWKQTCFELFAISPGARDYREFNFSPSGDWAAYAFTGYREGMATLDLGGPPTVSREQSPDRFRLQAVVRTASATVPKLALSAVIADSSGHRYYWALRHAPGKPDFHHASSFVTL